MLTHWAIHPLSPVHPYRRGPAVWGGRTNGFSDGFFDGINSKLRGTSDPLRLQEEASMYQSHAYYSPRDVQLGAQVQAQVDLQAGGQRFGIQYGQPPAQDQTKKWLIGGAIGLGLLYLWKNKK